MSREQAQREFLAKQAGAIRIRTAVGQGAGALGLRDESNRRCSQLTRWVLLALGHQPFVAHDRQTSLSQTCVELCESDFAAIALQHASFKTVLGREKFADFEKLQTGFEGLFCTSRNGTVSNRCLELWRLEVKRWRSQDLGTLTFRR